MLVYLIIFVTTLLNLVAANEGFKMPDLKDRTHLNADQSSAVIEGIQKMGMLFEKAEQQEKDKNLDCRFHCPEGLIPIAKPKHKVYPDGCGTNDEKFDFPVVPEIDHCCDNHDICYGTFGEKKKGCDKRLHLCLEVSCKAAMKSLGYKASQKQGCKMMSKLLLSAVMGSSCKNYKISQEAATSCLSEEDRQETETEHGAAGDTESEKHGSGNNTAGSNNSMESQKSDNSDKEETSAEASIDNSKSQSNLNRDKKDADKYVDDSVEDEDLAYVEVEESEDDFKIKDEL